LSTSGQQPRTLLVVPPFAGLDHPSLAVHLLQACARAAGFAVDVLYANFSFALLLGEQNYGQISRGAPHSRLAGERIFRAAAFAGETPPALDAETMAALAIDWNHWWRAADATPAWADRIATNIAAEGYDIVGCTTTFEQTLASVAMLGRLKSLRPQTITILGGGNCQGEMAEGIASLTPAVDYIFSGESERTFVEFLGAAAIGLRQCGRVIEGTPCFDMDSLPSPDYSEFFIQRRAELPDSPVRDDELWVHCEGSRGCWWGEKHHCTFCGFNGLTMKFRERTPQRLLAELKAVVAGAPTRRVLMTDNIMPHRYFAEFLPRLAQELPGIHIYWELKANLTLQRILLLKQAGVEELQPGIEALSAALLRRMDKGCTGAQNLMALRYACSAGLDVSWNLLTDFPGDAPGDYEETVSLIRLLFHLQPPTAVHRITLDRFSPYFDRPERYNVTNLRPQPGYAEAFAPHGDLPKIAYHFQGDYRSAEREGCAAVPELREVVARWRAAWQSGAPPILLVRRLTPKSYLLIDRRGLAGMPASHFLTRDEAAHLLTPRRMPVPWSVERWLERNWAVVLDGWFVPLATAAPELLLEFEHGAAEYNRHVEHNSGGQQSFTILPQESVGSGAS
jgi:ribosomal peptide maturation radical SAM protein 1